MHIGPYELNSIVTGDSRELAKAIPDESVDSIFTDPIYENVADYEWLGIEAMRLLKPNSACLVWCGGKIIDECKAALKASGLRFRWALYYACSAKSPKPVDGGIFPWVTPCWFFSKGDYTARPHINDWYFSHYSAKQMFEWNKGGGVIEKWLGSFSRPDDIVFDPFTGLATVCVAAKRLNRRFLAFEIDKGRATAGRERIASTSEPLFTTAMEQQALLSITPSRQREEER